MSGEALKKDLGVDLFLLLDKIIDREKKVDANGNTYEVFARGNEFVWLDADDVFLDAIDNEGQAPLEDQARLSLSGLAAFGDRLAMGSGSS